MTYSFSGNFNGTLGNANFVNDPGVFTFAGDTAGITSLGGGFYTNTGGFGTIRLQGLSPATFLNPSLGVESEFNAASFYDPALNAALGVFDPVVGSYDLSAPFGPASGFFVQAGTFAELTSSGELTVTGATGDVTFQAVASTPEPSSLLLLTTGFLAVAAVLRRRRLTA